jgi:phosphoglycerate kinase
MMKVITSSIAKGKTVFLRVDWNVPLQHGTVVDDFRILASLPTVSLLRACSAKIIVGMHLGSPKGYDASLSTRHLMKVLPRYIRGSRIMHQPLSDERAMHDAVKRMKAKDILVLENLRFDKGEKDNIWIIFDFLTPREFSRIK